MFQRRHAPATFATQRTLNSCYAFGLHSLSAGGLRVPAFGTYIPKKPNVNSRIPVFGTYIYGVLDMIDFTIKDEFIKLGQVIKAAGLVDNGAEAKVVVQNGEVKVNGETDVRRGRKIVPGDVVEFNGEMIRIVK